MPARGPVGAYAAAVGPLAQCSLADLQEAARLAKGHPALRLATGGCRHLSENLCKSIDVLDFSKPPVEISILTRESQHYQRIPESSLDCARLFATIAVLVASSNLVS